MNGTAARNGMAISQGDRIATGRESSAKVVWSDRTTLQLDENSDPVVSWNPPILLINVGYGWFLIDTGEMDVRIVNELAEIMVKSRVVVHVVPGERFDVYLLEGEVDLLRPSGRSLSSGEMVSIRPGGSSYGSITRSERAALEQRFSRWRLASLVPIRSNTKDDHRGSASTEANRGNSSRTEAGSRLGETDPGEFGDDEAAAPDPSDQPTDPGSDTGPGVPDNTLDYVDPGPIDGTVDYGGCASCGEDGGTPIR